MNQACHFVNLARAVAPLGFVLGAACQPTAQTGVAQGPTPVATAEAPPQHMPGMAHDSARAQRPTAAAGDSAMMQQMDPDTRFMHHMIAHHAQALVMTSLVPHRTTSQGLRLLAERIDISQKDEIALMRRWLLQRGKPLPQAAGEHEMHVLMPGMLGAADLARLSAATGGEFERLFLQFMIRHHEGALTMVAELLGSQGAAQDSEMFRLASDIDADQRAEISRMRSMLSMIPARSPG